jgi:hypothetical protein
MRFTGFKIETGVDDADFPAELVPTVQRFLHPVEQLHLVTAALVIAGRVGLAFSGLPRVIQQLSRNDTSGRSE